MNNNFDIIRNSGRLLYEYIRGSVAFGTTLEKSDVAVSDIDTSGVFYMTKEEMYGMDMFKPMQVESEKNDNVWFELNKFFFALSQSNPNILEGLYIPEKCILFETSIIKEVKDVRDMFISKKIYKTFGSYAKNQIKKARGLNKAICNPCTERKMPLDFCYTVKGQGSTNISNWLNDRGLNQKYCGLVNMPNMHDVYGVYYDFGNHIISEKISYDDFYEQFIKIYDSSSMPKDNMATLAAKVYSHISDPKELYDFLCSNPIGYKGIGGDISNELRLSSVEKGISMICLMSYNKEGYSKHCVDYNRYQKWLINRNEERYKSNLKTNYDVKNVYHMFRLVHMCQEILNGEGFNVDRTNIDRPFLMRVRRGEFEYDEIMEMLDADTKKMDEAYSKSTIREDIDINSLNDFIIDIKKKIYN